MSLKTKAQRTRPSLTYCSLQSCDWRPSKLASECWPPTMAAMGLGTSWAFHQGLSSASLWPFHTSLSVCPAPLSSHLSSHLLQGCPRPTCLSVRGSECVFQPQLCSGHSHHRYQNKRPGRQRWGRLRQAGARGPDKGGSAWA